MAGAGVGLLRDKLDHVFHNPDEVKEFLKLPLIGNVPHVQYFQGLQDDKYIPLQELDKCLTQEYDPSDLTTKDINQCLLISRSLP